MPEPQLSEEPKTVVEIAQDADKPRANGKPEGWEEVELTPAQQARFNRLYGQVKHLQRQNQMLGKHAGDLVERIDKLESTTLQRTQEDTEQAILAQIETASNQGDGKTVATLTKKLLDLKSTTTAVKPSEKPKVENVNPLEEFLAPEEIAQVNSWAAERNEDGSVKRPFFVEGHPKYKVALAHLTGLLQDDELQSQGVGAVMSRFDELMGVATPRASRAAPAVLQSQSTPVKRGPKLSLPEGADEGDARKVADAMGIPFDRYMKMFGEQKQGDRMIFSRVVTGKKR